MENGKIGGIRTSNPLNRFSNLAWMTTSAISPHMPKVLSDRPCGVSRQMREVLLLRGFLVFFCDPKFSGPVPVLGITSPTVHNELQHWACREQWQQWCDATKYHQAIQLRRACLSFTKYALPLSRADLRILTGLLTGHADLNLHLTLMLIRTDAVCPLCQEDEETVLHLLAECSGLSAKR